MPCWKHVQSVTQKSHIIFPLFQCESMWYFARFKFTSCNQYVFSNGCLFLIGYLQDRDVSFSFLRDLLQGNYDNLYICLLCMYLCIYLFMHLCSRLLIAIHASSFLLYNLFWCWRELMTLHGTPGILLIKNKSIKSVANQAKQSRKLTGKESLKRFPRFMLDCLNTNPHES